jgi:hypothetical protein
MKAIDLGQNSGINFYRRAESLLQARRLEDVIHDADMAIQVQRMHATIYFIPSHILFSIARVRGCRSMERSWSCQQGVGNGTYRETLFK